MIKEALQYIVGLGKAEEHMINGACYSDKPLHRIDTYYPKADAIEMHTLTSLVDYIKSEVDDMPPRMIVEVKARLKWNCIPSWIPTAIVRAL